MTLLRLPLFLLGAAPVLGSPLVAHQATSTSITTPTPAGAVPSTTPWNQGAVTAYPIHSSCNRTEAAQISRGLTEAMVLVAHARDHILRWGNSSEIYQKYFGKAPTGEPLGWFEKIVNGDKAGVLFRCDNPDGNCAQKGWAGHWRGSNATSETVICPLSYESRKYLEGMCGFGYNVANGPTNFYWASDLLHRLLHVPKVGEGIVEHYAGEYPEVLELAKTTPEEAVRNSDTLQYFALEAYAYDIALPGQGCAGTYTATSAAPSTSASASSATIATSATPSQAPSTTTSAAKECHTHADGIVHCT